MHRIVTFKIDEALLEALDRYAREKGVSRSEVIREAITELLEKKGYRIVRRRKNTAYDPRSPVIEVLV